MGGSKFLVAATATTLAITTLAVAPGQAATTGASAKRAAAAQVAVAPVRWGRCASAALRSAGARCGFVTVPLDHDDPSAGTVRIAVSRVRHKTRRFQGVMLVNPGGPGGSGLEFSTIGPAMPRRSGASYDWIGFDPRGVGASRPALSCQPGYFRFDRPPYVPRTRATLNTWLNRSESYAKACDVRNGALLENMRTVDVVRDIELIRQALGVRRINYYGYSYGTYLGQVYASMFPGRVRRMVLDSNVDPGTIWYDPSGRQTRALERVINRFFRWVGRNRATYRLGPNGRVVERRYLSLRRALERRPAGGRLGPSELDDVMLVAGYGEAAWPIIASGFADVANRRDARTMIALWRIVSGPGNDNSYAAFNATLCTDGPWPGPSRVIADARRLQRRAPVVNWGSTWYSGPCMFWTAPSGRPARVGARGVSPLLFSQYADGATPFYGSLVVRNRFPRSRLVAITGATHASTPFSSGRCANARLAAYLKRGALPARRPGRKADVRCVGPGQPKAARGAIRGAAAGTQLQRIVTPPGALP